MNNRVKTIILGAIIGINVCSSWADFTSVQLRRIECMIDVMRAEAFAFPGFEANLQEFQKQYLGQTLKDLKEDTSFEYLGEETCINDILAHIKDVTEEKCEMAEDDRMLYLVGHLVKEENKDEFLEFIGNEEHLENYAFRILRTYLNLAKDKGTKRPFESLLNFIGEDNVKKIIQNIKNERDIISCLIWAIDTSASKVVRWLLEHRAFTKKILFAFDDSNNLHRITVLRFAMLKKNPDIVEMLLAKLNYKDIKNVKDQIEKVRFSISPIDKKIKDKLEQFFDKYKIKQVMQYNDVAKLVEALNNLGEKDATICINCEFEDLLEYALKLGNPDIVTVLLRYLKDEVVSKFIKQYLFDNLLNVLKDRGKSNLEDLLGLLLKGFGEDGRAKFIEDHKSKLLKFAIEGWYKCNENTLDGVLNFFNVKKEFYDIKKEFNPIKEIIDEIYEAHYMDKIPQLEEKLKKQSEPDYEDKISQLEEKLEKALENFSKDSESEKAIRMVDINGQNLLHLAVNTNIPSTVNLVLEKIEATTILFLIEMADASLDTPVDLAEEQGNPEIIEALKKADSLYSDDKENT